MTFDELQDKVLEWAQAKSLLTKDDPKSARAQLLKTLSELGELSDALLKNDRPDIIDEFGDVVVTLIIFAELLDLSFCECLQRAYLKIAARTGKTVDGVFFRRM